MPRAIAITGASSGIGRATALHLYQECAALLKKELGVQPSAATRMMPMPGAKLAKMPQIQVVTTFFGGQGTINVNSWAPDSKRFAYVIYEPLPAAGATH